MPRFTKLSQAVYEKLGDEVTNQLIDWMNLMDAGWKEELRARGAPERPGSIPPG